MELNIRVVTAADDYVVTTSLMNIVQLERAYKTTASAFATGLSMEQLAFLAHEASKDAGHKPPPRLDDFLREIKTLTVVDEVPAPGPTEEGQ